MSNLDLQALVSRPPTGLYRFWLQKIEGEQSKQKQPTLHPRSSRRSPKTFLTFICEPALAKKGQLYLANLSLFGMGSLIKWRSECDEDNVGDIADYSELVDLVGAVQLDTVGGRGNLQTLPGCALCT